MAGSLRTSALWLSGVTAVDMATQLLMPMVLVRWLSATDFGEYRLVWLIAGTALPLLSFAVPNSLYYFVPRSAPAEQRHWFGQAGVYMALAGLVAAAGVALGAPAIGLSEDSRWPTVGFIGCWMFASLLDVLYNVRQLGVRQAMVNLVFVAVRVAAVMGTAYVTRSIHAVLVAHLLFAAAKALFCTVVLVHLSGASRGSLADGARWRTQLGYATPFGLSAGLYLLRSRMDQWIVASRFSASQFGLYSIAAIIFPIQGLIRSAINSAVLPEMNRLHQESAHGRMVEINNRANVAVALVMFPVLAFAAGAARPLLQVLFTHDYGDAAPVLRVYALQLALESMEVTMLLTAARQGRFMATVDALALAVGLAISLAGAQLVGLWGAALGAVSVTAVVQVASYRRAAGRYGLTVSRLQPWGTLARVLAAAALGGAAGAAVLAWAGAPSASLVARLGALAMAALATASVYWLGLRLLGMGGVVSWALGDRLARWVGMGRSVVA